MTREYPVGKAQEIILNALGLEADSFQEAEQIFNNHGIIVVATRQGRRSVPEVYLLDTVASGFAGGDGASNEIRFKQFDLELIREWIKD